MTNLSSIRVILCLAVVSAAIDTADAAVVFVNNRMGSNRNDGSAPQIIGKFAGPVRTVSRALLLAKRGDTISITNTGIPYYDSLTLVGQRLSGSALRPFHIQGNGAVLTGAMRLPPTAWQEVGIDLWKVVPYRKGHFQLVRNGRALEEVRPADGEVWVQVPKLADDQWCAFKGTIYFKAQRSTTPEDQNFAIARRDCGITILDAHDIRITGLIIRHFRLDGIHLHDRSENIRVDNVVLSENGRSGLTVRGTAVVDMTTSAVRGNRDHSILIEEFGGLDVIDSDIDAEPTVQ